MIKKTFAVLAIVALSATSGVVATFVADNYFVKEENRIALKSAFADSNIVAQKSCGADTHFTATIPSTEYPDLTYAAENAVKAVVNIEATKEIASRGGHVDPFFEFFGFPQGYGQGGGKREARAGGSGVIISEDGYIVTNNHVIEDASKLRVKLYDGRAFDAKVIGSDPATDVALLRIEAEGLPTIPFGSSDDLRLGEWVLAIGYPMDLQSTITAGIVSAKARSLGALNDRHGIESFIQTDAAVNPGNSGGALVNSRGELIGINTIIKTSTGSYVGYSFAVPETIVRKVVVDLKESGVVQRAVLGISFRAIDQNFIDEMGKELDIDKVGGIYVASIVEDGAASKAGLRKGDIIVEVDGVEVNDSAIFLEQIGKRRPGDEVRLKVRRNGELRTITAILQNRSGETALLSREDVDIVAALGGQFATASERICRQLDIRGGVEVRAIKRGGLLERARVKEGFIITHINDKQVYSVEDIERMTDKIGSIDGIYPNGRASSYLIVQ